MTRKFIYLFSLPFIVCCLLFVASGCGPTYTKDNFLSSMVDICKKDYNIDIKAKQVGRTAGIYLPVERIFEADLKQKRAPATDEELGGLKFSEDAAKKIDNVSLVMTRVALSTGAPVDFYVLVAADTRGSGIQIVMTRYVLDMRRLMYSDVSRGDYLQRVLMEIDFNFLPSAKETVKGIFYDMQLFPQQAIINRYFTRSSDARVLSPDFFLYLSELDYKKNRRFIVSDVKGLQVAKSSVLVKCRVKEFYTPAEGYEDFKFMFPRGFENEYLALVDIDYIPYRIRQIASLYFIGENGAVAKSALPKWLTDNKVLERLNEGDFFLQDIRLSDFLADQMANRIKLLYQPGSRLGGKFTVNLVKGQYIQGVKRFKVIFDIEKRGISDLEGSVDFNEIYNIISQMIRRYNFNDFQSVELFNIADAKSAVMNRDELLKAFWPRWLIRR